jgi:hypothetical protein
MANQTQLDQNETGGLGEIIILHPPGTFAITPASRIAIHTIGNFQSLLAGNGIDWGSGTGCLAITAARISTVNWIIGLEISPLNNEIARRNAILNGVEEKTEFFLSDSYTPVRKADQERLELRMGKMNFILANPPSSEGDDGFGYRRSVLRGAQRFLGRGGVIFLNISSQYSLKRVERLTREIQGLSYGGMLDSSDRVPFDLQRPDLFHCLELYAMEEGRGGEKYVFINPDDPTETLDARSAVENFRRNGTSPLTQWQTHLFTFVGD